MLLIDYAHLCLYWYHPVLTKLNNKTLNAKTINQRKNIRILEDTVSFLANPYGKIGVSFRYPAHANQNLPPPCLGADCYIILLA